MYLPSEKEYVSSTGAENLPAGQSEQEDLAAIAEYLPTRHAVQVDLPAAANLPACQEKQYTRYKTQVSLTFRV